MHRYYSTQVQAARVHGSLQLRSVAPLSMPSMADSWVWVNSSNQLMFGWLDLRRELRWATAYIGGVWEVQWA